MKTKDNYNKVMFSVNEKIIKFSKDLHLAIDLASTFRSVLLDTNNPKLIEYFNKFEFLEQVTYIPVGLDPKLESILKSYKSYVNYKIPYFKRVLNILCIISTIPYNIYYSIIFDYNNELLNLALDGNNTTIPRIGKLKVSYRKKKCNKLILDQKKTKEVKEYNELNDIKGDYRVFNTNNEFLLFSLIKYSKIPNTGYYHFEPTNYNNLQDRKIENYYDSNKTINDIKINTKIGALQKANALLKQEYSYKVKYMQNAN